MKYPMKLMISGSSIAELADNARKFLDEINDVSAVAEKNQLEPDILATTREIPTAADLGYDAPEPTPPPPIAQVVGTRELDGRGCPWDERIHSSSKEVTKKRSWRTRRGVEPAVVKQIEAELMAGQKIAGSSMYGTPGIPFTPPPPVPSSPFGNVPPARAIEALQPLPVMASPNVSVPNVPPLQPVAPIAFNPPPSAAPFNPAPAVLPPIPAQQVTLTHSLATFKANLAPVLAELVKQGKLNQEYIQALKTYFRVEQIWELSEPQTEEMFNQFVTAGLIQKVG